MSRLIGDYTRANKEIITKVEIYVNDYYLSSSFIQVDSITRGDTYLNINQSELFIHNVNEVHLDKQKLPNGTISHTIKVYCLMD